MNVTAGAPRVLFRLDAGTGIGSGHAMRCRTIAGELEDMGVGAAFAVSGEDSASFLRGMGLDCAVLGGDPFDLGPADGEKLGRLASGLGCGALLIDTYGVTDGFLRGLRGSCGAWTTYMDDMYTFWGGRLVAPARWDVDAVVNYTLGVGAPSYDAAYEGSATLRLVGTRYAPVGRRFRPPAHRDFGTVRRLLVTTGSTNPDRSLERMALACPEGPRLDVVVGSRSGFDESVLGRRDAVVHRGVSDLSGLMRSCDAAVTAGGTTVLELLACGVPLVAVPMVENQRTNVEGVASLRLGLASGWDWLGDAVAGLCCDSALRERLSLRAASEVDGRGAERIARGLAEHAQHR